MKQITLLLLLLVALCCASCSNASSQQTKAPAVGTASGTMTYKGKTIKLVHAYAEDARDLLDEGGQIEEVDILLSEQPLSELEPDKAIPFAVKMHVEEGTPKTVYVYVNGISVDLIDFDSLDCQPRSATAKIIGKQIEGNVSLSSDKCPKGDNQGNPNLAYETRFQSPINPPDDKKLAVTAGNGKPLPAGGGEAGKTALAYFAILNHTAALEIELAKARTASPPNENDIRQKQAQLDELFSKVKSLTPGGRNIEAAEPKELFALNVISNLENYEILEGYISGKKATLNLKASIDSGYGVKIWVGKVNLIMENSQWKILRVGMRMQGESGGEMYW